MGPSPPLTELKALSFDIYGTLIDWEAGIMRAMEPLLSQLPPTHSCRVSHGAAIAAFMRYEIPLINESPTILYQDALEGAARSLAQEWGLSPTNEQIKACSASVLSWETFPDTVAAMQSLGKRYKLIALSNVSHLLFDQTLRTTLKDVKFDAVYVAEDIGSYKPSLKNFHYLLDHAEAELVVSKAGLMHVAHGVITDQLPAEDLGISHAWIERGVHNWGDIEKPSGMRSWKTLGDMAASVEEAFGNQP